ncbi:MAG: lysylphosphatidylglycerol synthase transmembrane domain-containing protein [Actinomycetota bacterium]
MDADRQDTGAPAERPPLDDPPAAQVSEPVRPIAPPTKKAIWGRLIFLGVTGIALYVLWPSLLQVFSSWPELLTINPIWFPVMLALEVASFGCAWGLQRLALRTGRWFGVATSQMAGNAFSRIVPGGAAAGAALQYRLLVQTGIPSGTIGTALTATSLISSATLFALPVLALPAIIFGAPAPRGLTQAAWLGAALFALAATLGAVLISTDRPVRSAARSIQSLSNRFHKRHETGLPDRLIVERNRARETLGSRWWLALLTAVGNWIFDYLALLAALAAVGTRPRPSLVLLAYVASMVLGMIPITPGGLGFVEAGLTATLTLAGVPGAEAVLATLAYRLVSYWMPLAIGPFAYLLHQRRYRERQQVPDVDAAAG